MSDHPQNNILGNFLFKHRGIIPTFVLVGGLGVYAWQMLSVSAIHQWFNTPVFVSFAIAWVGESIRMITVGFSPKGTSGRNTHNQLAHQLNTKGIYSVTRNPLYLGNFLIWLSVAILTQSIGFIIGFLVFFWWFYHHIIQTESQFLKAKFDDAYTRWADRTPAFFPSIKNYASESNPFNWRKVIRKEKNGIAAIMGIFGTFEILRQVLTGTFPLNSIWLWIGFAGLVYYIAVKLIMKHTDWLKNRE